MKRLILIAIGIVAAGTFIGRDAVHAFFDTARSTVRAQLMTPEMELQSKLAEAQRLGERCGASIIEGKVALTRLDTMIGEREQESARRQLQLERDRKVLEDRRALLKENRPVYLVRDRQVGHDLLNRDALLRAKAFAADREVCGHLDATLEELKVQRQQTAAEIEEATVEETRLQSEVATLKAELENLRARRAVAQTRESLSFDRSAFDQAREKIAEIRATIAEQNKRLDFYGRRPAVGKGLLPDEGEMQEESAVETIDTLFGYAPPVETSVAR